QLIEYSVDGLKVRAPTNMDQMVCAQLRNQLLKALGHCEAVSPPRTHMAFPLLRDARCAAHSREAAAESAQVHDVQRQFDRNLRARPRSDLALQVVGMNVDHAGDEKGALQIDAAGNAVR